MSREELDQFYRFASERLARGEGSISIEAALSYWRSQRSPQEPSAYPSGQTLAQRLEASGVLGSSDTGPHDLSTNPVYMDGFGES